MCGILLSEDPLCNKTKEFIKRRGNKHSQCEYNGLHVFSSVLSIRSDVDQPIVKEKFLLQYNGEIYNNSVSDTLFISDLVQQCLCDTTINSLDKCFSLLIQVYNEINKFENEIAISIVIGHFVLFFKDDVGRRSIGYKLSPFTLSSMLYTDEIDSMKLYVYDVSTKQIHSIFKPQEKLVLKYISRVGSIKEYLRLEKNKKSCLHLSAYDEYINNYTDTADLSNKYKEQNYLCYNTGVLAQLNILFLASFKKRQYDGNAVVLFSGGIDSLIVALYTHLTIEKKLPIYLINTAVTGSFDREMGILSYKDLSIIFPNRTFIFIENELIIEDIVAHKDRINELIYLKNSKMDFNLGAVLYFSAKIAKNYSNVVFLGSGADEVFGGYNKYKSGNSRDHMFFDLFTISTHNLCRDDRIISNWCVEARFPVLDREIICFSLDLPESCFLNNGKNKFILREILKLYNFDRASEVPKKAMQYGTGMSAFEDILYKNK